MTYAELLQQNEWTERCNNILKRDKFCCCNCGILGYHNKTSVECQNLDELDSILDGLYLNNYKMSDFIRSEYPNSSVIETLTANTVILNNDGKFGHQHTKALKIERPGFNPELLSTSDKIDYHEMFFFAYPHCDNIFNNQIVKGKRIRCVSIRHFETTCFFDKGGIFIFNENLCDNVHVSIQRIYSDRYRRRWLTNLFDDIILSITFSNICVTLYLTSFNQTRKITKDPGLNIHHKYYIQKNKPWEYDDEALITLCEDCHKNYHQNKKVPVYRHNNGYYEHVCDAEVCSKCGGSGYLPQYSYYEGGVCFECNGEGVILPE